MTLELRSRANIRVKNLTHFDIRGCDADGMQICLPRCNAIWYVGQNYKVTECLVSLYFIGVTPSVLHLKLLSTEAPVKSKN